MTDIMTMKDLRLRSALLKGGEMDCCLSKRVKRHYAHNKYLLAKTEPFGDWTLHSYIIL